MIYNFHSYRNCRNYPTRISAVLYSLITLWGGDRTPDARFEEEYGK